MTTLSLQFILSLSILLSFSHRVVSQPASKQLYQAHGWTLWASFGVLFPIGIIIAKYCQNSLKSGWFMLHWIIQLAGILSAAVGVAIGYAKFNAPYASTHAKLGQALSVLIWVQPIIAVLRPKKNEKNILRKPWYFIHWLLGTAAVILGWLNISKGLDIYTSDWSDTDSMKLIYIGFAVQVAVLAFVYLFVDRWKHMMEQ